MPDTYRTRHRISGVIDENTPQHILDSFSDVLEVVGPDAKPYLPEMHRVSLPKDPTHDELEIARVAGLELKQVEKVVDSGEKHPKTDEDEK